MKLTKASAKVLMAFLANPRHDQYGFGLMKATGVKSGSLYPILDRFERRGWIEGYDEPMDERTKGRPPRRMYRLTGTGRPAGRQAVLDFYRDLGPAPGWLPGRQGA